MQAIGKSWGRHHMRNGRTEKQKSLIFQKDVYRRAKIGMQKNSRILKRRIE